MDTSPSALDGGGWRGPWRLRTRKRCRYLDHITDTSCCLNRSGVTTIMSILFLRETYAPFIYARSQGRRRAPTTIGFYHSITRPLRMLLFAPIATTMSLYMSLIYGVLYLHLVTVPLLFGPIPQDGLFTYGWKNGNDGLAYLGAGIGLLQCMCLGHL